MTEDNDKKVVIVATGDNVFDGIMVTDGPTSILSTYTEENYECPECHHTFTFHLYNGMMVGVAGNFVERIAMEGYCPDCLTKKLCEQFGVKMDKKEKEDE